MLKIVVAFVVGWVLGAIAVAAYVVVADYRVAAEVRALGLMLESCVTCFQPWD